MPKKRIKNQVWEKDSYYDLINSIKLSWDQPGMSFLKEFSRRADAILDLGCGEGSRLGMLKKISGETKLVGVDISSAAVKKASKKAKGVKFIQGDLETLKFESNSFDLVYSFFVLEHLDKPEKVLKEAVRVTAKSGHLVLVCPNYGAPNRSSPPFRGSRFMKLISGLVNDLEFLFTSKSKKLDWRKVEPIANDKEYQVDWDTTVEPYVLSLSRYLKGLGLKVEENSSGWSAVDENEKFIQRIIGLLGKVGLYPFKYWGPQLVIVASKQV